MRYKLKSERVGRGIKQLDLANELKISPQYLGNIEKGLVEPRRDLMIRIAQALGNTTVQKLFFDDGGEENEG